MSEFEFLGFEHGVVAEGDQVAGMLASAATSLAQDLDVPEALPPPPPDEPPDLAALLDALRSHAAELHERVMPALAGASNVDARRLGAQARELSGTVGLLLTRANHAVPRTEQGMPSGEHASALAEVEAAIASQRPTVAAAIDAAPTPHPDDFASPHASDAMEAPLTGDALPSSLRGRLEGAIGADLEDVRVHQGPAAADLTDAHDARAVAVGRDIHLGRGEGLDGVEGERLIAHEVAHTVQSDTQPTAQVAAKRSVTADDSPAEIEADRFADAFVAGDAAPSVVTRLDGAIARSPRGSQGGDVDGDEPDVPPSGLPSDLEAEVRALLKQPVAADDEKGASSRKQQLVEIFTTVSSPSREILHARLSDAHDSLGRLFRHALHRATRKQLLDLLLAKEAPADEALSPENTRATVDMLAHIDGMDELLEAVAALKKDGERPRVFEYVTEHRKNHPRLYAALLTVELRRNATPSELELLNDVLPRLDDADCAAIVVFVSHKLGHDDAAEGILAQIDAAAIDPGVLAVISALFPNGVSAGPWNPGKEPPGAYIGKDVHRAIGLEYQGAHAGEVVYVNDDPIGSILRDVSLTGADRRDAVDDGDLRLKPDITNVSTLELYEIKPATDVEGAVSEAELYVGVFQAAGVDMKLGDPSAAGTTGVVSAPGGHAIFWSPAPGAIVYRKKNGDFVPTPAPQEQEQESTEPADDDVWSKLEKATGLTGPVLVLYLIISEGSRIVFPPRNAIPAP